MNKTEEQTNQTIDKKDKFPERLYVVAASKINFTGRISWKFVFDSNMPEELSREVTMMDPFRFGYLQIDKKNDNHFSPWKWAEACKLNSQGKYEEAEKIQFAGDDGVPLLGINVFKTGDGENFVLAASIEDRPLDERAKRSEALAEGETDALALMIKPVPTKSILLVHASLVERIKGVCERNNVELILHEFDGELVTC